MLYLSSPNRNGRSNKPEQIRFRFDASHSMQFYSFGNFTNVFPD